jgi:hypothetical protein
MSPVLASRFGAAPVDPAERIEWLERKCRAQRAKALSGCWSYDLALHRNLLTVLEAERAALSADETSLASPDQRDVRAAA